MAELHYAAEMDDVELIEIIAGHPKVNLNAVTSDSESTPLIIATGKGRSQALKCLLEKGADASCVDKCGCVALMEAAKRNPLECVDILLKIDDSVAKLQDKKGMNALMYGIGNPEIVEKLIKLSDLSQVTKLGDSVLHRAASRMNSLKSTKIILEQRFFDIDVKNSEGRTPLYCAIKNRQLDIADCLVQNGANLSADINYGWRLYNLAIETDETETFLTKYLINDPEFMIRRLVDKNRLKVLKAYATKFSESPSKLGRFLKKDMSQTMKIGEKSAADCLELLLSYEENSDKVIKTAIKTIDRFVYFKKALDRLSKFEDGDELINQNIDEFLYLAMNKKKQYRGLSTFIRSRC